VRLLVSVTTYHDLGLAFALQIDENGLDVFVFGENQDYFALNFIAGDEEPRRKRLSIGTWFNQETEIADHCY
jgi:hypothetical protein